MNSQWKYQTNMIMLFFRSLVYSTLYLIISLYEPTEEQRFSFMCERFNGSEGHIFDVTMIITNA